MWLWFNGDNETAKQTDVKNVAVLWEEEKTKLEDIH
jgi:hypothetical protein